MSSRTSEHSSEQELLEDNPWDCGGVKLSQDETEDEDEDEECDGEWVEAWE
ncbi:hypothetical protein Vi05172_g10880 [Venturia inaequalis]|nr:hypothetical protein Vi05172_g10880 [Venturia inaequalis]